MLFKTSLTGLNAASSEFQVTANNIANVGTDGFKRSRATFSDLYQSSQAMRKSVTVGQGSTLKRIVQDFGQGGIKTTENALDLAITGPGFFPLATDDGQNIFTRNGTFKVDENNVVRNALGAALLVAEAGSDGSADLTAPLRPLIIPSQTTGEALATSAIDFRINFNAETPVVKNLNFDRTDPSTYSNSAAIRVYDSEGTEYLAFAYYQRTQAASLDQPLNKYRSYIFIGDQQVTPVVQQAQTEAGSSLWMNRYGELKSEKLLAEEGIDVSNPSQFFRKYNRDDQVIRQPSVPASVVGGAIAALEEGGLSFDDATTDFSKAFTLSSDSSDPVIINLSSLEGMENASADSVASIITREINNQMMGDQNFQVSASNKNFSVSVFNPETEEKVTRSIMLDEGIYTKERMASEIQTKINLEVALSDGLASETFDSSGNRLVVANSDTVKNYQIAFGEIGQGIGSANVASVGDELRIDIENETINYALNSSDFSSEGVLNYQQLANNIQNNALILGSGGSSYSINSSSDGLIVSAKVPNTGISVRSKFNGQTNKVIDLNPSLSTITPEHFLSVGYNRAERQFEFKFENRTEDTIILSSSKTHDILGIPSGETRVNRSFGRYGIEAIPNGPSTIEFSQQRNGLKAKFEPILDEFGQPTTQMSLVIQSGSTGDNSTISVSQVNSQIENLLNFSGGNIGAVASELTAQRGIESKSPKVYGIPISTDHYYLNVNDNNNTFTIKSDEIRATIKVPPNSFYTINTLVDQLQKQINSIEDYSGNRVGGLKVEFNSVAKRFEFTGGTSGDESFLSVKGSKDWGLRDTLPGYGEGSSWIQPVLFDSQNEIGSEVWVKYNSELNKWEEYIDQNVNLSPNQEIQTGLNQDTVNRFVATPTDNEEWRPVFLDKGTLTFDNRGMLESPKRAIPSEVLTMDNGQNLDFSINFLGTTMLSQRFRLEQEQNGRPEGNLNRIQVGEDGLVSLDYQAGDNQILIANKKVVMGVFPTNDGLRQAGDSTFLQSGDSGAVIIGEPQTAGIGSIRSGALEASNVDLTQELLTVMIAQRNYQANSKMIEATSQMITQIAANIR